MSFLPFTVYRLRRFLAWNRFNLHFHVSLRVDLVGFRVVCQSVEIGRSLDRAERRDRKQKSEFRISERNSAWNNGTSIALNQNFALKQNILK